MCLTPGGDPWSPHPAAGNRPPEQCASPAGTPSSAGRWAASTAPSTLRESLTPPRAQGPLLWLLEARSPRIYHTKSATQAADNCIWVWGGWYIVCCHDAQDYPFLPRTEASSTDDPHLDVLQFLPDHSHFIILEITNRKETLICLNAVEVIYLTIKQKKRKKKKTLFYRYWILKQKKLKHQLHNAAIHPLPPYDH